MILVFSAMDKVISFGVFDMSEDEDRAWRAEADADETQRTVDG